MTKILNDYLYGLKRSDSDLAYDGVTKLVTSQTTQDNNCVLIRYEKQSVETAMDTMLVLSTIKPTIYPGSVVLANSDLVNGTPTEVSLPKTEGKITIDAMPLSAKTRMDSGSVNSTIDKLLLKYLASPDPKLKPQANFRSSFTEVFTKRQVNA